MNEGKLHERNRILTDMNAQVTALFHKFCEGWHPKSDEEEDTVVLEIAKWVDENYIFDAESSNYPNAHFINKRTNGIEVMQLNFDGDAGESNSNPICNLYGSILHAMQDAQSAAEILKKVMGGAWQKYGPRFINDFENDNMDHGTIDHEL